MFAKKQAVGKLYELRGIVAGMIAAVDGETLTLDQSLKVITSYCVKASDENATSGADGE